MRLRDRIRHAMAEGYLDAAMAEIDKRDALLREALEVLPLDADYPDVEARYEALEAKIRAVLGGEEGK